jgi:hypothetical protein
MLCDGSVRVREASSSGLFFLNGPANLNRLDAAEGGKEALE